MANNPETLFGMFQKYATQKKTTFKDWCAFIAWVRKCKPDVNVLNKLDVLSPDAYEKAIKPKTDKSAASSIAKNDKPVASADANQASAEDEKKPAKTGAAKKMSSGKKNDPIAPKE